MINPIFKMEPAQAKARSPRGRNTKAAFIFAFKCGVFKRRSTKNFILIFLLSLVLQLFFLSILPVKQPSLDAWGYDQIAWNIATGKGFSMDGHNPTSLYPLYPVFLSLIYSLFGRDFFYAQVILSILVACSCGVYYLIGRSIFSEKIGILAAVIMSVHPAFIGLSRIMYAEPLFIFLLSLFLFAFIRAVSSGKRNYFVFAAVMLGLAILTKPYVILYPLIAIAIIIASFKGKERLIFSLIFALTLILTCSPWIARNYFIFGDFRPVSGIAITAGGIQKVDYLAGYNKKQLQLNMNKQQMNTIANYYEKAGLRQPGNELDVSPADMQRAPVDYSATPGNIFSLIRMMFISSYSDILDIGIPMGVFFKDLRLFRYYAHLFFIKAFNLSLSVLIFLLAFGGIISSFRSNLLSRIIVSVLVYYVLFFYLWTVFFGQVGICGRYGMPVLGILILFAAKQVYSFKKSVKEEGLTA